MSKNEAATASRFRFRVWDKKRQQMGQQIEKHIAAEDGTLFVVVAFTFSDGKKVLTLAEALREPERYVVMQSTGLLDRSGKEIFEGDIVQQGRGEDKEVGEVKWDSSWGCYSVGTADVADCSIIDAYREEMRTVKVIGNIHEHSHLIPTPL